MSISDQTRLSTLHEQLGPSILLIFSFVCVVCFFMFMMLFSICNHRCNAGKRPRFICRRVQNAYGENHINKPLLMMKPQWVHGNNTIECNEKSEVEKAADNTMTTNNGRRHTRKNIRLSNRTLLKAKVKLTCATRVRSFYSHSSTTHCTSMTAYKIC